MFKKIENKALQKLVVVVGVMLFLFKFFAFYLTKSNAIFTDALESIINIITGLLAFWALIYAAKPPDKEHPYGHGKIGYIFSGFEGGLISLIGVIIIIKSINDFFYSNELQNLDLGLIITLFAGLINYFLGHMLVVNGRKNESVILVTDGKHLLTDAYSSLGIILGLGAIYLTDIFWIDNLIAVSLGAFIAFTGYKIIKISLYKIMDSSDLKFLEELMETIYNNKKNSWINIHRLKVIHDGTNLHIDCHMTVPYYFSVEEAHFEVINVEQLIDEKYNKQVELFIHTDPCTENYCKHCQVENCIYRKHQFENQLKWNIS